MQINFLEVPNLSKKQFAVNNFYQLKWLTLVNEHLQLQDQTLEMLCFFGGVFTMFLTINTTYS